MGGADDVFALGPRGVVLPAVSRFAAEVNGRCGLKLQWGKTEYFSWRGDLPEGCPEELKLAGRVVEGVFRRGFLCWGVPVGEDEYVAAVLGEKVDEIVREAATAVRSLQQHRQAAWAVLKRSVWPRFDYWAMHCYPSDSLPAARELDRRLWMVLEEVCGLRISHQSYRAAEDGKCGIQVPEGCSERENWSFAAWVARQPVKLGGMGLRSMAELCYPAFLGAMEQTLPRLHKGFCPMLTPVVGGEEEHGEGATDLGRWRVLLDSGSRVGAEFAVCWRVLKAEAQSAAEWLGGEVEGPLAQDVASAGESCSAGNLRSLMVEHRERTMGRLLEEGLARHPDQAARPVWSWQQRDKHSSQWLLTLPGHDTMLSSEEFSECVAAMLCLGSPACSPHLGTRVGRSSVDRFGDKVMAAAVAGDGWRRRHDTIKMRILSLLRWSGIEVDCEVFNIFSGLIPQQGLSRLEQGRKRQGLVPDFRVRLPTVGGGGPQGEEVVLAELKVISCCPTRYPRNPCPIQKAVDKRASTLPAEYRQHARKVDTEYGGVLQGVVGPVEAKLLSFPPLRKWVFGAWGEASEDVHLLVKDLAKSRAKHLQQLEGRWRWSRRSEEAEVAVLTGQVRRLLSLEAVRSQARCLLDRVRGLGAGAAQAARRRQWAEEEERRLGRERQAHLLSLGQGYNALRRGQFLI